MDDVWAPCDHSGSGMFRRSWQGEEVALSGIFRH